ncbi:hypothetical protein [Mucilaginibacter endophyticus]|uniref:hypothetical protein n=1 Tax=Mucilaginibacter endophyticus TaxID=2675003 RepID=UPI000E0D6F6A|nr:hypothetical protein [Mucilaginibacter endophyticus]
MPNTVITGILANTINGTKVVVYAQANIKIMATKKKKDSCWSGYTKEGMKKKDGKTVPNCVKDSSKKD